ncbi:unnamed protein product [Amoebophrya sp. A120]|nr:unnamed protein product [Amoebophrya sp. A120]|eukprot:GSA120T00004732001.1
MKSSRTQKENQEHGLQGLLASQEQLQLHPCCTLYVLQFLQLRITTRTTTTRVFKIYIYNSYSTLPVTF